MTPASKAARKPKPPWLRAGLGVIVGHGFVGLLVAGLAILVADLSRVEKTTAPPPPPSAAEAAAARPAIAARWTQVQARLVARLHQANPPEFGAVWAMRSGEICGLVNGRGSFGGLSGMVRFHTLGGEPVFNADHRPGFKEVWLQCDRDRWIVLRAGSDQTGFCATQAGQARCKTVKVELPK